MNAAQSIREQRHAVERFFARLGVERERLPYAGEDVLGEPTLSTPAAQSTASPLEALAA